MIRFDDTQIQKDLKALHEQEEEQLVQRAASIRGLGYVDLSGIIISTDALSLLEEVDARSAGIAGFKLVGDQLHVAVLSEQKTEARSLIRGLTDKGYTITLYLASNRSLRKAWDRYKDLTLTTGAHGSFIDITDEAIRSIVEKVHNNLDVKNLFEQALEEDERKRTSRLMEIIMGSAIATKSSDVHIEPQEDQVRLRYRQDGILEDILFFSHAIFKQIDSRIKILSKMKLNIDKKAQDGRFTIDFNQIQIEIRVSTVPGPYGEGFVMRILDPAGISVGLEELGIEPFLMGILRNEIAKPNGLILNTGPTGSGKTTTLYSFLKEVYNPEIKVITIEDPIEYHLEGITQTQTGPGYDFEAGLRAAMRQDPDVILVGEIRDSETALAAMQAAQTGHLVFSTLHTNNAAGVVPRLLDLGINHATLAQSLTIAIAQRLVRKLTPNKKKVAPTLHQEQVLRAILKNAEKNGKDLSRFNVSSTMDMSVYEPVPDENSASGYKGRLGIFEAILADDRVKDILDKTPTDRQVRAVAHAQGILTLAEDAAVKVLTGITSYEEVNRVVDLEEEIHDELAQLASQTVSPSPVSTTGVNLSSPYTQHVQNNTGGGGGGNDIISQIQNNLREEYAPERAGTGQSLSAKQVSLLVDYLKMLENHQHEYPDQGIAGKLDDVKSTIIELLKNNNINDLFLQQDNERLVKNEIELLMHDLENLKEQQVKNPNIGVADKLRTIRTAIETLAK